MAVLGALVDGRPIVLAGEGNARRRHPAAKRYAERWCAARLYRDLPLREAVARLTDNSTPIQLPPPQRGLRPDCGHVLFDPRKSKLYQKRIGATANNQLLRRSDATLATLAAFDSDSVCSARCFLEGCPAVASRAT